MSRRLTVAAALVAAGLALPPASARAAGFAIFEQGSRAMGFGGAFAGLADDPSAIFYNSAGIAFLKGTQVYAGGTAIHPVFEFTGADPFPGATVTEKNTGGWAVPPAVYLTRQFSERVVFGLGFNTPFGLKTEWENPATYSGRFISQKAELKGFSVNPVLAFKLADRFAIGGGVDVRLSSVSLARRVPFVNPFTQRAGDAAQVNLDSNTNTAVGFNVGALAKLSDTLSAGVHYRHKVKANYTGEATFTILPTGNAALDARLAAVVPSGAQAVETAITYPGILTAGVAWKPGDWTVSADVDWYQWSTFDQLPINFVDHPELREDVVEKYSNSMQYRIGVERRLGETLAVRGGYFLDKTPSPVESVSAAPARRRPQRHRAGRDPEERPVPRRPGQLDHPEVDAVHGGAEPGPLRRHVPEPRVHPGRLPGLRVLRGDQMRQRSLVVVAAVAAAALLGRPAAAQTNFTSYVVVGDSLAAGFESNSLVETHQLRSVPALIAHAAGVTGFQMPLVSEPGIPPELTLVTLVPSPVLAPKSGTSGVPKNLGLNRPYNDLAVPGATSVDALTRVTDSGGLHDLILRGLGTQVQQAVSLRPTVVMVWIGNNDVLGAAVRGRAIDGVTLTPTAAFQAVYSQIISALKGTGAFVVAANLPDVTTIPYVTTLKPYLVNPATGLPVTIGGQRVPLLGPSGPLPESAYVTLAASTLLAQGIGIPTAAGGTGVALPDEVILDPGEVAIIRDHVDKNNQAIRDICAAAGIPVLDIHAKLNEIASTGRSIGGVTLTSGFLTGGVFSYDGVHPTDLGYAVIANDWIDVINSKGGALPYVDLGPYLGVTGAGAGTAPGTAGLTGAQAPRREAGPVLFSAEAYQQLLKVFPLVNRE